VSSDLFVKETFCSTVI